MCFSKNLLCWSRISPNCILRLDLIFCWCFFSGGQLKYLMATVQVPTTTTTVNPWSMNIAKQSTLYALKLLSTKAIDKIALGQWNAACSEQKLKLSSSNLDVKILQCTQNCSIIRYWCKQFKYCCNCVMLFICVWNVFFLVTRNQFICLYWKWTSSTIDWTIRNNKKWNAAHVPGMTSHNNNKQ